jgi:hypothetical protein
LYKSGHCYPLKDFQYRLLFPYENNPLVKNFGFILDREKDKWKTIADELVDPRIEEEEGELCAELANSSISQDTDQYFLNTKEEAWFLSDCIANNLSKCERRLEIYQHSERLVSSKSSSAGQTALAYTCIEGHLAIVKLLGEHGANLETVNDKGYTPLMLALIHGRGQTAFYLAQCGACLFAMNHKGTTAIAMAKNALQELNEMEQMIATIPIYAS